MKILHVAKRYPNSFGGDSVVVWQLVKHQQVAGDTVNILTTNCKDIVSVPGLRKVGLPIASSSIDAINLKRILTLAWLIPWSFWYLWRTCPDVIHSHTADFGFGVSLAARLYRIPIINTCHGVSFINPDHSFFKRKLEIFFLKSAGYKIILTVDENSLSGFAKAGIRNVRFIANAVDIERFDQMAQPYTGGRLELFNVGRMETAKGVKFLLDAVAALDKNIDWRLRLVSDGAKLEDFKAYAAELGMSDRVEFLGRVMPKKNAQYYAESHIFILPSLHEGFPIVLLEAWAAGVPVIITKVGTITSVCHDAVDALLIDAGSSEQITKAIQRLAASKALRLKLAKNGRELVKKNYTYDIVAKQIKQLYQEVIA